MTTVDVMDRPSSNGLVSYKERLGMDRHQKKTAIYRARREALEGTVIYENHVNFNR